jgi:hypothetical protein
MILPKPNWQQNPAGTAVFCGGTWIIIYTDINKFVVIEFAIFLEIWDNPLVHLRVSASFSVRRNLRGSTLLGRSVVVGTWLAVVYVLCF